MEIRNEPYWYYKEQLPSLTSNQIVFFDKVHIQHVSGTPVTIKLNKHNIQLPKYEEGNTDVKNGKYVMNNQPTKSTFDYEQEGRFYVFVANIESMNGKITVKQCLVY